MSQGLFRLLFSSTAFLFLCDAIKGPSPEKAGYATPRWAQQRISAALKKYVKPLKAWDSDYLAVEAGEMFSGCRNARGWLSNWENLTGRCMTTIDSGYIGCVGAIKYDPAVLAPEDQQELYKSTINKIIDKWGQMKAFQDPDVEWIHRQPEVFVGCSINPFCEKFTESDPGDELALEGPDGVGTFETMFVLACNLGTATPPLTSRDDVMGADVVQQFERGMP